MTNHLKTVGIIGLGRIGSLLAPHLLSAGFTVVGYDVREPAMAQLLVAGGSGAKSPADLADQVDVVITSLPSSQALEDVVCGPNGLVAGRRGGLDVIETSTLAPEDKERRLCELAAVGITLLDCPISGTANQLQSADVVVYCSGDLEGLNRQANVIAAFSRQQYNVGEFGNGSRLKLLANHLVAIHTAAAAEVLLLARRSGIDVNRALQALADGAGSSRMLELRGPMIIERDYADANMGLDLFLKDLELIKDLASASGSATPLLDICAPLYQEAARACGMSFDAAAVIEVFEGIAP